MPLKVTTSVGGVIVSEQIASPEVELAIARLRDAYVGFPWCQCPDRNEMEDVVYFEDKHGVSHGWECTHCLNVVQVG